MTPTPDAFTVYLVTDETACRAAGHTVCDVVRAAIANQVDAIQVRSKDATAASFLAEVLAIGQLILDQPPGQRPALIVNDRLDVALVARNLGAPVTGVHIGHSDLPPGSVRSALWPGATLGISLNDGEQLSASKPWADYFGIGPIFATATKSDAAPALGVKNGIALAQQTSTPCLAIGGIDTAQVAPLAAGGFAGVAVASGICRSTDPGFATACYRNAWLMARAA